MCNQCGRVLDLMESRSFAVEEGGHRESFSNRIYHQLDAHCSSIWPAMVCSLIFAVFARVGILVIVNYYVFTYIGPLIFGIDYLGFGQQTLQLTLGLRFVKPWDVLVVMLMYTSIFNALQTVFSLVIPFLIFMSLSVKIPEIASGSPWISKFTKHRA